MYLYLVYLHLATILPAFVIGSYLLLNKKGSLLHKRLGRVYMVLMLLSATVSLFMEARVGSKVFNHFGPIHILSVFVLYFVPSAYFAARKGNIALHKKNMVGLYIGGLLIAGGFAFMPGRLLHSWLFS